MKTANSFLEAASDLRRIFTTFIILNIFTKKKEILTNFLLFGMPDVIRTHCLWVPQAFVLCITFFRFKMKMQTSVEQWLADVLCLVVCTE